MGWRSALLRLGGAWLAMIALFASDWIAMAGQWWNSSTYNHILLVPLIIGWLVHQRLPQLRRLIPQCWWPGLIVLAGAVLLWVLGAFAGFNLLRQAGAVAMLAAAVLLFLGPKLTAGLWFPLCYMAFLVPFGDELVPPLQSITAVLTIFLTHASGIPATVNGVFIDTPVGLFVVAEACSGVKFLIAMIALGVLVGNVCFTSWRRRIAFMALAIIVPIVANGIRAWGTIYLAQSLGVEWASGFDHIVYGWIFFAIVIALVLGLSWRFFDRPIDDPMIDAAAINHAPLLSRLARFSISAPLAFIAAGLMTVGGLAWANAADQLSASMPSRIALPVVTGWQRVDYRPTVWWEPRASGADHRLQGRYRSASGHEVDVFLALYAAQAEGREAGGFGEGALRPDTGWAWSAAGAAVQDAKVDRLLAGGSVQRLTETYYRTGSLLSGSNLKLKMANMQDRLLLRARPTTMLILSAEDRPGFPAEAALAEFRQSAGPVDQWMDRIGSVR